MSEQIVSESQFLFSCVLSGICVTVVYDILRVYRRVVRHSTIFVAIEDIFFWIAASFYLFYILYKTNNGVVRWFSIVGAAIGMLIYKYTLGEHIVEIMSTFIKWVQHLVKKAFGFVLRPLKRLIKRVFVKVRKRKDIIKKVCKKKLTKKPKKVTIDLCKHKKDSKIIPKKIRRRHKAMEKEGKL